MPKAQRRPVVLKLLRLIAEIVKKPICLKILESEAEGLKKPIGLIIVVSEYRRREQVHRSKNCRECSLES